MARLKALLIAPFVNLSEQFLRRVVVPANDTDRMGWIDKKRSSPALAMSLDDGVRLQRLVLIRFLEPQIAIHSATHIAEGRLQVVDLVSQRLGHFRERHIHIGKERIAALFRNFDRMQQGRLRR